MAKLTVGHPMTVRIERITEVMDFGPEAPPMPASEVWEVEVEDAERAVRFTFKFGNLISREMESLR